jgi:hypothetical protein
MGFLVGILLAAAAGAVLGDLPLASLADQSVSFFKAFGCVLALITCVVLLVAFSCWIWGIRVLIVAIRFVVAAGFAWNVGSFRAIDTGNLLQLRSGQPSSLPGLAQTSPDLYPNLPLFVWLADHAKSRVLQGDPDALSRHGLDAYQLVGLSGMRFVASRIAGPLNTDETDMLDRMPHRVWKTIRGTVVFTITEGLKESAVLCVRTMGADLYLIPEVTGLCRVWP